MAPKNNRPKTGRVGATKAPKVDRGSDGAKSRPAPKKPASFAHSPGHGADRVPGGASDIPADLHDAFDKIFPHSTTPEDILRAKVRAIATTMRVAASASNAVARAMDRLADLLTQQKARQRVRAPKVRP